MKFKRILATAFALALTLPLLAVSAHPGRTDSAGGHTDSDTGDYHYHHGYEAHAHFDGGVHRPRRVCPHRTPSPPPCR